MALVEGSYQPPTHHKTDTLFFTYREVLLKKEKSLIEKDVCLNSSFCKAV